MCNFLKLNKVNIRMAISKNRILHKSIMGFCGVMGLLAVTSTYAEVVPPQTGTDVCKYAGNDCLLPEKMLPFSTIQAACASDNKIYQCSYVCLNGKLQLWGSCK